MHTNNTIPKQEKTLEIMNNTLDGVFNHFLNQSNWDNESVKNTFGSNGTLRKLWLYHFNNIISHTHTKENTEQPSTRTRTNNLKLPDTINNNKTELLSEMGKKRPYNTITDKDNNEHKQQEFQLNEIDRLSKIPLFDQSEVDNDLDSDDDIVGNDSEPNPNIVIGNITGFCHSQSKKREYSYIKKRQTKWITKLDNGYLTIKNIGDILFSNANIEMIL